MKKNIKINRKPSFEILIVPNVASKPVKKYNLTFWGRVIIATILIVVIGVAIGYIGYVNYTRVAMENRESAYVAKISELESNNSDLNKQVADLSEQVQILSSTVNQKVEAVDEIVAEIEEKKIPDGFPLSGTVELPEEKDEVLLIDGTEVKRPIQEFKAPAGTTVIATGDGVVTEVTSEITYGYQVTVDHNNGYKTIYRSGTVPNVNVGDEIPRGGTIYVMIQSNDEDKASVTLGYQIMLNDEYVNPSTVLKIDG